MTYYWDMDGVLADFHKAANGDWSKALRYDFIVNLPAFEANVKTLNEMIAAGVTCYILTKAANADARRGKIDWLKKYVPAMDEEHFICLYKGRKVDSMKEEGTLIDDDLTNIKQWRKAGYNAIYLETKGEAIHF